MSAPNGQPAVVDQAAPELVPLEEKQPEPEISVDLTGTEGLYGVTR